MEIVLIRHAQPDWEPDGRAVDDPGLTRLGRDQAKLTAKLKKQLKGLQKHYQDDSDISEKPKEWQQQVRPGA